MSWTFNLRFTCSICSRSEPLDNRIVRISAVGGGLFRTVSSLPRTCVAGCTCRIAYSSCYRASGRTSRKLPLIYNRGSATRHDSNLPRNKRLREYVTFARDQLCETCISPPRSTPARLLFSLSSFHFLTFTDAFLKYGTTFRRRRVEGGG